MSVLTLATEQVAVFDDVLTARALAMLRRDLALVPYQRVYAETWTADWRLSDGHPLRGPLWWLDTIEVDMRASLVEFSSALVEHLSHEAATQLVGSRKVDWQRASIAPWIYPEGTALSLHVDGGRYTGAYVFFFHDQWRLQWGGCLIVLSRQRTGSRAVSDDGAEASDLDHVGHGRIVLPKPNRLVILSGDAPHLVSRVDRNAGDHLRLSLGGFFHRERQDETRVYRLRSRGFRAASKMRMVLSRRQTHTGT